MIDLTSPTARRAELIGAAIVILLVIGFSIWYMATHRAPAPFGSPEQQPVASAPLPPTVFEEHGDYYDITATYPSQTPLAATAGDEAERRALNRIEDFIEDSVLDFKRQGRFESLTPEDVQIMGLSSTRKENLTISYEPHTSPTTVSYVFTLFLDTLGAHPNMFYRTFTFDRQTGEERTISDLFAPRTNYLNRLSTLAEAQLLVSLGEWSDAEYIRQGVTADAINFQTFFVSEGSLHLLFPPYQVAPYAAGPREAVIPLSELADILRPEYQP